MLRLRKQLSVYVKNKPGELARICGRFRNNDVNVLGLTVADTVDHAVDRFIVDKPEMAQKVLEDEGLLVVDNDVLTLELNDGPGNISEFANRLSQAGINIEYAYYTVSPLEYEAGSFLVAKVSDPYEAREVLTATEQKRLVGT